MKKISYKELGQMIGSKATAYFGRWYSDDVSDYEDCFGESTCFDIQYLDDGKIIEKYFNHIELYEVGKPPLIIDWEEHYIFKNQLAYDMCIDYNIEYYI